MIRVFRCIKTEKNIGSNEKELNTDPAEGTVKIESVTVTNFSSVTQKLSIGIRSSGVDKDWHPIGEPWTIVFNITYLTYHVRIWESMISQRKDSSSGQESYPSRFL